MQWCSDAEGYKEDKQGSPGKGGEHHARYLGLWADPGFAQNTCTCKLPRIHGQFSMSLTECLVSPK